MKLLLTSGGIANPTIRAALVDLLGKPIEECRALAVPTAKYGHPGCDPESVRRFIAGEYRHPNLMCEAGWASIGVLELTALPTIGADRWVPWVRETDVLLVDGGDATYLGYWLRESGLADLLPSLPDLVWVGMSAGSMALTPRIGREFANWASPSGEEQALGLVDFSIFPHLDYPGWPDNSLAAAQRWATTIPGPAYAIDDHTAISVVDGVVEVHSEGHWELLNPTAT